MKLLVACEESQIVCTAFRSYGVDAYSCDIVPTLGNFPQYHYTCNLLEILHLGWDAMIAFPPCTHLARSGARYWEQKRKDGRQQQGIDFFMSIVNAPIERIAIENPIGIMTRLYKKPDQIIQPYFFGDNTRKATCLWLKNFPKLVHNKENTLFWKATHVKPILTPFIHATGKVHWYSTTANKWYKTEEERYRERSRTFQGIADAMASQWSPYLL